jgi:hypothetical protein
LVVGVKKNTLLEQFLGAIKRYCHVVATEKKKETLPPWPSLKNFKSQHLDES